MMELFEDGKDLIINEGKNINTKQWRTAMLFHLTGPHVLDIFSKLVNPGKANNHVCSCYSIKWIFSSQSQLIFCPSEIWPTPTKARWDIFAVCIELKKKKGKYCNFGADFNNQIRDLVLRKCRSDYVNHKLFEERQELTLAWMLELPEQCERAEHQISYLSMSKQGPEDANRVYKKPGRPNGKH